jgi:hypothetical protein
MITQLVSPRRSVSEKDDEDNDRKRDNCYKDCSALRFGQVHSSYFKVPGKPSSSVERDEVIFLESPSRQQ